MFYFAAHPHKMRGAGCCSAAVPVLFMHACEMAGNWDFEDYHTYMA